MLIALSLFGLPPPPPLPLSLHTCSWWYVKECPPGAPDSWLTCKGAVELWEPRPDVFPGQFAFNVGYPLALHNR